jgi:hypothetical protein
MIGKTVKNKKNLSLKKNISPAPRISPAKQNGEVRRSSCSHSKKSIDFLSFNKEECNIEMKKKRHFLGTAKDNIRRKQEKHFASADLHKKTLEADLAKVTKKAQAQLHFKGLAYIIGDTEGTYAVYPNGTKEFYPYKQ